LSGFSGHFLQCWTNADLDALLAPLGFCQDCVTRSAAVETFAWRSFRRRHCPSLELAMAWAIKAAAFVEDGERLDERQQALVTFVVRTHKVAA
jgi:hypothetical protein